MGWGRQRECRRAYQRMLRPSWRSYRKHARYLPCTSCVWHGSRTLRVIPPSHSQSRSSAIFSTHAAWCSSKPRTVSCWTTSSVHERGTPLSAALPAQFMGQTDVLPHENGRVPGDTLTLESPHVQHSPDSSRLTPDRQLSTPADWTVCSGCES
jgi:hypothetical protein